MSESQNSDAPKPSETPLEYIRRMFEEKGAGKSEKFLVWSRYRLDLHKEFHIERDLERLVEAGVAVQTLAVAMLLINIAPSADEFLKQHFGDRKIRGQKAAVLREAIAVMQEFDELFKPATALSPETFLGTGQPLPSTVITALESYSFLLQAGELVFDFLNVNSLTEVTKYVLAAVVHAVTGRYLDREVSALTGAALQNYDYDETAHRVWRIRNFERLSATKAGFLATILEILNSVVSSPT